ncbi:MAG: hypothetical protein NZ839_02190 [Endomicrobia bacterium]|nr:hypothetical protein [Endomicrobiia bacterium]MCX7716224.1 hypothetical protein [Endomicrobiia bacterium]
MKSINQINSILYVCSGNVFRSVFAEGYTKHLLTKYGIENIQVFSCGIIAEPNFKLPESIKKVFEIYKITEKNLANHIPTRISWTLLSSADLVLVMDNTQIDYIKKNFYEFISKTFLLKEYVGFLSQLEIYDPIGQPESVYLQTVEEIKICVEILIKNLVN